MAARKKAARPAQTELFAAQYIIKHDAGGMTWYRANWVQLRATLPQDELDRLDPGTSSWVFWTSNPAHAERLSAPPPGWSWDRLTPAYR